MNLDRLDGPGALRRHLDRLAETLPGWPDELPPEWLKFRQRLEWRVAAKADLYRNEWRVKGNADWAAQRFGDALAYVAFDDAIHDGEDADLALTASWYAFKAVEALCELRGKRNGSTGAALPS